MKQTESEAPGMTAARKALLGTITKAEAAAGAQAWKQHAKQCRAIGMVPTPFANWLAKWLEVRRADQERPLLGDQPDEGRHEARDYWRPFARLGEKARAKAETSLIANLSASQMACTNGFEFARKRRGKQL
jgi:hypothetical protein